MAGQKLVLDAELRNGISKQLKQIQNDLNSISVSPGMHAATGWFTKTGKEAGEFMKTGAGVPQLLTGIGLGAITTAASIGGLTSQLKALGGQSLALRDLSRDLSMMPDDINRWSNAGAKFGVAADSMQDKLKAIAAALPALKWNSSGPIFETLSQFGKNGVALANKLKTEGPGEALKDILQFMDKVYAKSPQLAKKLAADLGLGDDVTKLVSNGGYKKFLDEYNKMVSDLDPINPELAKQAQNFREAVAALKRTFDNFENAVGPTLLEGLTNAIKAMDDFGKSQEFKDAAKDIATSFKSVDWKAVGGEISAIVHELAVMIGYLDQTARFIDRYGIKGDKSSAGSDKTPDGKDHRSWGEAIGDAFHDMGKILPFNGEAETAGKVKKFFSEPDQGVPKGKYDGEQGLLHKSSWDGAGNRGLLQNASFVEGTGSDKGAKSVSEAFADVIMIGTKTGVLAAFREFKAEQEATQNGLQAASFSPGSGVGGGLGAGLGGAFAGRGGASGAGRGVDGPVGDGLYSAISKAEGARDGYDTVFANGAYGKPNKPVSQMTLREALAFSEQIRHNPRNHANAGPIGAFQIVARTLRAHASALGMNLDSTKFDEATQKALARHIAKTEGLGAWEGLKLHPDMMAQARRAMSSGNLDGTGMGGLANGSGFDRAANGIGRWAAFGRQCVDLVKTIAGDRGGVQSWERGMGADSGGLKHGSLLATFLDRNGQISSRYAGGGTGTQGVNRDHAAVFDRYIMRNGQRVGMHVLEQDRNHPIHGHDYMFGQRGTGGERNASNYFEIMRGNRPLGGTRRATLNEDHLAGNVRPHGGDESHVRVHITQDAHGRPTVKSAQVTKQGRTRVTPHINRWDTMPRPSFEA